MAAASKQVVSAFLTHLVVSAGDFNHRLILTQRRKGAETQRLFPPLCVFALRLGVFALRLGVFALRLGVLALSPNFA
jgi:hypothetical protein